MRTIKNFLSGGDSSNTLLGKKIEMFLSIIIVGYFGIKIVYGSFFGFYPEKYYYRNVEITSNDQSNNTAQNITVNAIVPGMWNNEMTDFVTLVVLAWVVYIYTNSSEKSFIDASGNLNFGFLFGYILGLGYPAIYTNYKSLFNKETQESNIIKYIYLICSMAFIAFIVILNYTSITPSEGNHKINYIMYVIVIALLFGGLLFSKKNTKNYNSVTYFYSNGENCSFNKYGVVQSSGDIIKITIPFMVFIILLLFSYEPIEITMKTLYTFMYGALLGVLVSSISYYGIEYFLQKTPQKQCDDLNECTLKEMPAPQIPKNDTIINVPNIPNNNTQTSSMSGIKIALVIMLVLVVIYLIYFSIRKFS